jgi:hypothetical protein
MGCTLYFCVEARVHSLQGMRAPVIRVVERVAKTGRCLVFSKPYRSTNCCAGQPAEACAWRQDIVFFDLGLSQPAISKKGAR